jgi:hypothetical protein
MSRYLLTVDEIVQEAADIYHEHIAQSIVGEQLYPLNEITVALNEISERENISSEVLADYYYTHYVN